MAKFIFKSMNKAIPQERLKVIGETEKRGTMIRFLPDPEIFKETTDFSFDTLSARMRELAFLNKGLKTHYILMKQIIKTMNFILKVVLFHLLKHINAKKDAFIS